MSFPPAKDLPDPGIKPGSPEFPANSLPLSHQGPSLKGLHICSSQRETGEPLGLEEQQLSVMRGQARVISGTKVSRLVNKIVSMLISWL